MAQESTKASGSTTKPKTKAKTAVTNSKATAGNCVSSPSGSTANATADERRLRKLKVFLKSISFNGSEGSKFETLNDLYFNQVLTNEFPCGDLDSSVEYKCNATPFIVASCFNRTQLTSNKPNKVRGTSRRAPPSKKSSTPLKQTKTTPAKSSKKKTVPQSDEKKSSGDDDKNANVKLSEKGKKLSEITDKNEKVLNKSQNDSSHPGDKQQ